MDFGESIAISLLEEGTEECLYKEKDVKNPSVQEENTGNDDVASPQANAGSILGANLAAASHGDPDYLNDEFYAAPKMRKQPRCDSTTGDKDKVRVNHQKYDYIVAAHHLIPGNAALKNSLLFDFMCEGKKVPTVKGDKEIKANIGYCVNGTHNGVWLPGNYAFGTGREETPTREKWSDYVETMPGFDWATKYMIGAIVTARAQFHDAHTTYNENARDILDKLATTLCVHPDYCKLCEKKRKIPPPYSVKAKLYKTSKWLKQKLLWPPEAWKLPWITSDRFKDFMTRKRNEFLDAYKNY
jgi:A nuclease family of the HNH/ENDO VII superfamily with conserved AHH